MHLWLSFSWLWLMPIALLVTACSSNAPSKIATDDGLIGGMQGVYGGHYATELKQKQTVLARVQQQYQENHRQSGKVLQSTKRIQADMIALQDETRIQQQTNQQQQRKIEQLQEGIAKSRAQRAKQLQAKHERKQAQAVTEAQQREVTLIAERNRLRRQLELLLQ
jgi:hypothetical protein